MPDFAPPTLTSVTIRNYKSIAELTLDFDNPMFLVGPNGSGKTNVVAALKLLSDAMRKPLHQAFEIHGGFVSAKRQGAPGKEPGLLSIEVHLSPSGGVPPCWYSFALTARHNGALSVESEKYFASPHEFDRAGDEFTVSDGVAVEPESDALLLPLVGGSRAFSPFHKLMSSMELYSIIPLAVAQPQVPDGGARLSPAGENAASVLREIRGRDSKDVERIAELLGAVTPGIVSLREKEVGGGRLTIAFTQDHNGITQEFDAFQMSDGTLRALGILLAVFQKPAPSVLIIEEPEATIHPGALGVILDALKEAAETTQLIVTTHCPDVLDAEWIEDRHIRMVDWKDGATRVSPLAESSRSALRDKLMSPGELLRANALVGEASERELLGT